MSRIPDDVIDQVRDATDIVTLISESVDLKRTGGDFRGPCPFHGGTHRNFAVIGRKGLFYCYVCHEKGDAFSFLMKRFGMDYPTAVRELARRAGIVVPESRERIGPDPNEPIYAALASAHDWFARRLVEDAAAGIARSYLERREISLEVAQVHGLGWAPSGPAFLDAMKQLGIEEDRLLTAGLAARRDDGRMYSRFRERLLFPIHDLRGRVVGFGGRLLGPGEPKYLNSPETPVFQKGRMLYNLHHARQPIRQEQAVVVVEGYFDVLRLVLVGVDHVIAPLGTALTPEQAALIRRSAPQAILLYDSDTAGLRATFRAGDELLRHGVRVRVATLPEGEDPDTLAQKEGQAGIGKVLRDSIDVLERKVQLLDRRGWFTDVEHRRDALDRLLPTVRAASDPITRDLYLGAVSDRTGVSRDVLERELREAPPRAAARPAPAVAQPEVRRPSAGRKYFGRSAEEALLALALTDADWRQRVLDAVKQNQLLDPVLQRVYAALMASVDPSHLPDELDADAAPIAAKLLERREAILGNDLDQTFVDSLQDLEARPLLARYSELDRSLRAAPDHQAKDTFMSEKRDLKQRLQREYPKQLDKYVRARGTRLHRTSPPRSTDAS